MTELKHKEKVKMEELKEDSFMEEEKENTADPKYEPPMAKETEINF